MHNKGHRVMGLNHDLSLSGSRWSHDNHDNSFAMKSQNVIESIQLDLTTFRGTR